MALVLLFEEKFIQTIVLAEVYKVSLVTLYGYLRKGVAVEFTRLPGNR